MNTEEIITNEENNASKKSKKTKTEKTLALEDILYKCRVALRGVGTTEKNRDAVLDLIFLKFASDKFEKRKQEIIKKYGDVEAFVNKPAFYLSENIMYLKENVRCMSYQILPSNIFF